MNLQQKLNKAYQMYFYVCSKSRDGWNVLATFLIEATSWFVWLLRRTSPLLHLSQDWCVSTCKQQWRCRSTIARLASDLGPPSKFPESSVKGLPAWALEMYLIEQQGRWYWHRRWTSMPNRLPLFIYLFFLLEIGGAKAPSTPRLRRPGCSRCE